MIADGIKWWPTFKVIKYGPETVREITKDLGHEPSGPELRWLEDRYGLTPDEVTVGEGNSLVTSGLNNITKLIIGSSATAFTATQGWAGVGDSSTATTAGMTTLQASTNKYYQAVDGAPTQSGGQISANMTLTGSNGNFAWNEWVWGASTGTITAGTSVPGTSPQMLNRAVQSLGTKTAGSTWTLQATVTLS